MREGFFLTLIFNSAILFLMCEQRVDYLSKKTGRGSFSQDIEVGMSCAVRPFDLRFIVLSQKRNRLRRITQRLGIRI